MCTKILPAFEVFLILSRPPARNILFRNTTVPSKPKLNSREFTFQELLEWVEHIVSFFFPNDVRGNLLLKHDLYYLRECNFFDYVFLSLYASFQKSLCAREFKDDIHMLNWMIFHTSIFPSDSRNRLKDVSHRIPALLIFISFEEEWSIYSKMLPFFQSFHKLFSLRVTSDFFEVMFEMFVNRTRRSRKF